jgi:hypothetical protein
LALAVCSILPFYPHSEQSRGRQGNLTITSPAVREQVAVKLRFAALAADGTLPSEIILKMVHQANEITIGFPALRVVGRWFRRGQSLPYVSW